MFLVYFGLLKLTGELGKDDLKVADGVPVVGRLSGILRKSSGKILAL